MYIERHRRRETVRMSLIPPSHTESYVSYLAAMQMAHGPETRTAALGDEPVELPALQFLKSLDDLDEEDDEDDELDLDDEEDEEEDDLDEDEDYDDEDEEDDEDEDEEEDEDEDVKPLKMTSCG
jgi:hypothetical protein